MENCTCPKYPKFLIAASLVAAAVAGALAGKKIASNKIIASNIDADNVKIQTASQAYNYNTQTGKLTQILTV